MHFLRLTSACFAGRPPLMEHGQHRPVFSAVPSHGVRGVRMLRSTYGLPAAT
jgi:hypothetical protein